MRIEKFVLAVAFVFSVVSCLGQPTILAVLPSSVKSNLNSENWGDRANAMLALAQEDSTDSREALITLLDKETEVANRAYLRFGGTDAVYGESYGEYLGQLTDLVMKIADNPTFPRAIHVLARSSCEPDSYFARWLAMHGETILPDIVRLSENGIDIDRRCAAGVLGEMLSNDSERKLILSQTARAKAKMILIRGLKDSTSWVKDASLDSLTKSGDPTDIAALKEFMLNNREKQQEDQEFLRKKADKAISSIRARAASMSISK